MIDVASSTAAAAFGGKLIMPTKSTSCPARSEGGRKATRESSTPFGTTRAGGPR